MHPPEPRDLLSAWERGSGGAPVVRGLLLLGLAVPGAAPEDLLHASIGHRDAWLLSLRECLFGSRLECLLPCPACREGIELSFDIADVRAPHALPGQVRTLAGGQQLRAPTSADLLAIGHLSDATQAEQQLLARCHLNAGGGPEASAVAEWASAAGEALGRLDEQAEVVLALDCPACAHHASQPFDILAHLWVELDHWARGMLRRVHAIASRYGWSEADILALSTARRQAYLDLIGAG